MLWCLVHDTTGDVKLDHSIEIAGWGVTNEHVTNEHVTTSTVVTE